MTDEQIFRLILIAGFAIVMPVSMYHRVKSQASRESLDRRQGHGLPRGIVDGLLAVLETA